MTSTQGAAESSVLPFVEQTYRQPIVDLTDLRILRAFDEARTAWARREFNEDGVLRGFDALELHTELIGVPRALPVTVTATLVDEQGSCHAAEYRAALRSGDWRGSGEVLSAQAWGWTWLPSWGLMSRSLAPTSEAELGDGS
jgi:hypothetical protein